MQTNPLAIILLTVGIALLPGPASHAAAPEIPPAAAVTATGDSVIATDWSKELIDSCKPSEFGKAASGVTASSVKLITEKQPENFYGLQAIVLNQIALKKGDTLFLRFAARSLQSDAATGATKFRTSFGRNSPPWGSSYSAEIGVGKEWQRFDVPFTCKDDFAIREAKASFMFGYPVQMVEIADLQLIRYEPTVAVASLPKTARHADAVSPEKLEQEISRIARMRKELAVADPAPAKGRTLHVSQKTATGGDGSTQKPFASIPAALAVVKPGDTVLVAEGEYREPWGVAIKTSGTPDAWIKIQAAPGPRPRLISSGWHGFGMSGGIGYIQIEGFELDWTPDPAVTGEGGKTIHGVGIGMEYATHHIRVLNNVVHGFGTGGIISLDCDYLYVEGNLVYNCAKTSPYGGSAISFCRAFDFDAGQGYRNVIRGNVCHDNELKVIVNVDSGGTGRTITDGNGIIIDVFNRSRKNPLKPHNQDRGGPLAPYHGRTLVENNLIYDNGGRGIHVFRSSYVDVVNNTTYMNQKSADIQAGEFTAVEASHVNFFNNLAYGRKEKRGNTQDGSTFVIWSHNLFYNDADVLLHDGIIEADPLFAAAALDAPATGFRLQRGSPAFGQGTAAVAPPVDLVGALRPAGGPVDIGAYQESK